MSNKEKRALHALIPYMVNEKKLKGQQQSTINSFACRQLRSSHPDYARLTDLRPPRSPRLWSTPWVPTIFLVSLLPFYHGCGSGVKVNNGETQLLDDYPMRFNDLNTGSRVGVFTKIAEYDEELLQTILRTSKQLNTMVFRVTNVSTAPRISVTLLNVHPITGKKSSIEYPPDADFQVSIAKDSGLQGPQEVTFDIEFDPSVLAQIDKAIADNRARAALEEKFGAARIAKLTAFFSENRASGFQGLKRVSAYSLQLQVQ